MPRLRRPEAEGVLTMPDRLAEIQLLLPLLLSSLIFIGGCACADLPWVQLGESYARCTRGCYVLLPWFGNCHLDEACFTQHGQP